MRFIAAFSVTPPASDSACNTVVFFCDAVRAGILDVAEHIDRLRARHEDRVAIAQLDVLRQRPAFELADARPEDLGARFLVRRDRARCAHGPSGSNNRHFTGAVGSVEPARASASMSVMPPVERDRVRAAEPRP